MLHISLFSGIGGFELAAEWMGWQNIVSCEINPFGRKVLEYYWPNSYHHDDIKTLNYDTINNELTKRFGAEWRNDDIILTGGFPCQPYSLAGKRKGKDDERHLFPEMLRIIREVKPSWIVGENVFGIVSWNGGLVFHEVQTDLEAEGYEVQPYVLPAVSVNAPHRRDRVWFVAYCNKPSAEHTIQARRDLFASKNGNGNAADTESRGKGRIRNESEEARSSEGNWKLGGVCGISSVADTCNERLQRSKVNGSIGGSRTKSDKLTSGCVRSIWQNFPTQSPICSRNDGLSSQLDGITFSKWRNESIKAAGNAIVPQVVLQIFKAIEAYMSKTSKRTFWNKR
jgi:DNA (cytosine-5)-methyltransferase 1